MIASAIEPGRLTPTGTWIGHVLVDGFRAGSWKAELAGEAAMLRVRGIAPAADVQAEGDRLLGFIAPQAARREVRFG